MQAEITLDTARNMSLDELKTLWAEGMRMKAEGFRRACIALTILLERGIEIPGTLQTAFRYHEDVANGTLSPHAVLELAAVPVAFTALRGMPHERQDAIANGEKIKIAVRNKDGRIVSAERTIREMSPLEIRLAFSDGKVVDWSMQGEWYTKQPRTVTETDSRKKPDIRVDSKTKEIVIGRSHLTVDDLIPALSALGFVVKPAYGTKGIEPVKVV